MSESQEVKEDRCVRCGGATTSNSSGSITQWVKSCSCDAEPLEPSDNTVQLCANCHKRINVGRHGSLTQWIFRVDLCSCKVPEPISVEAQSEKSLGDDEELPQGEPETELEVDSQAFPLERYSPLAILGTGAGSTVYLGRDRLLLKKVAIKTMRATASDAQIVAFQKEAKATSSLNHQGIVRILDFGITMSGAPFMVMDYCKAESLYSFLQTNGPLDQRRAFQIFSKVCEALQEAHILGIFHRDIKCSNILVGELDSPNPQVRLIDFGIGLMQKAGDSSGSQGLILAGTPNYMSPDQGNGFAYDEKSEIYSVGCALFETLTGRTPYEGSTALDLLNQHANAPVPSLSSARPDFRFSQESEALVSKCLSKSRQARYQSAGELLDDLRSPLESNLEHLSAESAPSQGQRSWKLHLWGAAIATLGITLLVGFQNINSQKATKKPEPRRQTRSQLSVDPFQYNSKARKRHFVLRRVAGQELAWRPDDMWVKDSDLSELSQLEPHNLDFKGCDITGDGIKYVIDWPVVQINACASSLNDQGLEQIARVRALKQLMIAKNAGITDDGLRALRNLPNLSDLDVSFCSKITNSGVGYIVKGCKNLEKLVISGTEATGESLPITLELPKLRILSLGSLALEDRHFVKLIYPKTLLELDLTGNPKITDQTLERLAQVKSLRILKLGKCTITNGGLARFAKKLPRCEVRRNIYVSPEERLIDDVGGLIDLQ